MSRFMSSIDALTPMSGAEHKYLCENIDIIKSNKTNQVVINNALKAIGGVLSRCYNMNITTTILDTLNDADFFAVNIYPEFKDIRTIVGITCGDMDPITIDGIEYDSPREAIKQVWMQNDDWHIDFDGKLFYDLSHRFTAREIVALLIYQIEATVFCTYKVETIYRCIKHMVLNIDYRTNCIAKSSLCRNFFIIPFIQACSFTNFISEIDDDSIMAKCEPLAKDYLTALTKITTYYSSGLIDRPSYELKQSISYIINWVFEAINDLKYSMTILKKSLKEQITAEKSYYVKNLLVTVFNQFAYYDFSDVVSESAELKYLKQVPQAAIEVREEKKLRDYWNSLQAVGESSESELLDKLGRCKRITQEEIDVLRLECEKIESVDDKIYYMEKVYDKLAIVDNALSLIGDRETKGLVRDSKDKLLKQKEQLLQIREIIINKRIAPERYGLFIKYPVGYEG